MAGKTKTFTVTDAAAVPVTAVTYTTAITIQEDPSVVGWPTQNFSIRKPFSTDTPIQRPIGGAYGFSKGGAYAPGEIAGYVQLTTVSTSTTFQQDET